MKHWPAYLNKLITCLDAVCFLLLVEEETAINYVVGGKKKGKTLMERSKKFDKAVSLFKKYKLIASVVKLYVPKAQI